MLSLLLMLPLLLLVWRIGFSSDPRWMRVIGFALLAIHYLAPQLLLQLRIGAYRAGAPTYPGWSVWTPVLLNCVLGFYLIFWGIRSRDPAAMRLASGVAGVVACGQILVVAILWVATVPR